MENVNLSANITNAALAISIIISLLMCFFGYRLQRLMATVTGFIAGGVLGMLVSFFFLPKDDNLLTIALIVGIVVAIIGAIVAFALYKAGIFIYMFSTVFTFVYNVFEMFKYNSYDINDYGTRASQMVENMMKGDFSHVDWIALVTAAVVSLLVAIITLMYLRNVMIVTTAISGAVSAMGSVFLGIFNYSNPWVMGLCIVVLMVLGCVFQFKTTKKYQHKKS